MIALLELFVRVQLVPPALNDDDGRFVASLGLSATLLMPVGGSGLRSADPNPG